MAPTNLGAKDSPCKMNKWQTGLVPSRHKKAVMGVQDSLGSWLSLLKKRVCRFVAFFVVLGAFLHGDFWEQGHPHQPVKIFAGVTYCCERLAVTQEGGGLVHWVRIDLAAPGVELYVTPLDPAATARGPEWGEVFGDPVVATALLDRLLHHAVVIQIEGSRYRLREHADLMPEDTRRFSKGPRTHHRVKKTTAAAAVAAEGWFPMKTPGRGNRRLPLQSCGPSTGTVQEANRSAPATGRRTGVKDQGGHRRPRRLRAPTRSSQCKSGPSRE